MKSWHIFYDDGRVFSNYTLHSLDVPRYGVICIVQEREDGQKHILHGKDFYLFVKDSWIPVDNFGMIDHVLHKLDILEAGVAGRTITSDLHRHIMNKAKQYMRGING